MAGRMGGERVTVADLEVVQADPETDLQLPHQGPFPVA